jgi:hypothetical protein
MDMSDISDPFDVATRTEETERERAIAAARQPIHVLATGACLFCEEPAAEGVRFCDATCRDGFDNQQKLRRQRGGR